MAKKQLNVGIPSASLIRWLVGLAIGGGIGAAMQWIRDGGMVTGAGVGIAIAAGVMAAQKGTIKK